MKDIYFYQFDTDSHDAILTKNFSNRLFAINYFEKKCKEFNCNNSSHINDGIIESFAGYDDDEKTYLELWIFTNV